MTTIRVDLEAIRIGDVVTRMLSGIIPMKLTVSDVTDTIIHCGDWTFDRATGAEIDEDLGWGPPSLMTGSFLKHEIELAELIPLVERVDIQLV